MVFIERAQPQIGALPLTQLARIKCLQNAHLINDIGITPYHLVEPILKKKSAKALKLMEMNSPQIITNSEPLWRSLITRDFSDRPLDQIQIKMGKKVKIPARDLYDKYAKEREKQRRLASENLKQLTKQLSYEKNKNKVKALNHVIVPSYNKKMIQHSTTSNTPVFRSTLLQKASQQNKIRSKYLGQAIRKPRLYQVSNTNPNTLSKITTVDSSQLSSSNLRAAGNNNSVPLNRGILTKESCTSGISRTTCTTPTTKRPGLLSIRKLYTSPLIGNTSPTKRKIDLSITSPTKKLKPSTPYNDKNKKSNVYIYSSK